MENRRKPRSVRKPSVGDANQHRGGTRLLYPYPVSTSAGGHAQQKTFAFIPLGGTRHQVIGSLERELENAERKLSRSRGDDRTKWLAAKMRISIDLRRERNNAAREATDYLKYISPRERGFRERLRAAGVPVEEPSPLVPGKTIDEKGRQIEWYERGNFRQLHHAIYSEGSFTQVQRNRIVGQIGDIICKMHAIGLTHEHLHLANFVVNEKGKVKLIDFSLMREDRRPVTSQREFLKRFGSELWFAAQNCSVLVAPREYEDTLIPFAMDVLKSWLPEYAKHVKTFGVTPTDIFRFATRPKRKAGG